MKKPSFKLPPLNQFQSRGEWEGACWKIVSKSNTYLSLLTTAYDRRNIIIRAAALEQLSSGKSYKQITDELWLSPQTISSIKKICSENIYKSYWERSKSERKRKAYSTNSAQQKRKPKGRPVRTKYGTVHIP